jgi:hypothetical protein
MATQNSKYKAQIALSPQKRIEQGDQRGRVHVMYDEFQPSAAVVANGDIIKFQPLPAGARVVDVGLAFPDQGTTGSLKLGWEDNGIDGANDAGFMAAVNLNAAAATVGVDANAAGFGKKFSAETSIIATMTAATDASSTTVPLKLKISFVLD